MSTGAREFKDEFVKSLSFQMVVVPSALALIGLWVGDWMQEPKLATLLTFGLMVLFFALYWWNWSRRRRMHRQRTLVDGSRVHRSYPGLVFAPSILQPDGEDRFRDQVERIRKAWQPDGVVCVVSAAADQAGGIRIIEQVMAESPSVVVTKIVLSEEDDLRPRSILDAARSAVDLLGAPSDVLVDITAGSSVLSVGLYEAAMETNANAGYIDRQRVPRLILESEPEEEAM